VYEVTDRIDGKDYPWGGQAPGGADTVSLKRVGKALEGDNKKGGKLIFKTTITFSSDGKVMTLTTKGVDANGKPFNSVGSTISNEGSWNPFMLCRWSLRQNRTFPTHSKQQKTPAKLRELGGVSEGRFLRSGKDAADAALRDT
jgi:hypothetical protein